MIILSHPTGNANVRAVANALYAAGVLREFHSGICWPSNSLFVNLLPPNILSELNRRSFPDIPYDLQVSHPLTEVLRLILPLNSLTQYALVNLFTTDTFFRIFDKQVAQRLLNLSDVNAVYAYEDSALMTFHAAAKLGLKKIYDLPIGYWRLGHSIFAEECELQPDWASTLTGLHDSRRKLEDKDEEIMLSDIVIVPSQFVRSSLLLFPYKIPDVRVVPFGSPSPFSSQFSKTIPHDPLRVLFVGSLGQRKGLSYLLEAIANLGSLVRLTLIGKPVSHNCNPLNQALLCHRWIPSLHHSRLLAEMRDHDVLVLPSLFEGYALVISEALSQGLPVIATNNSGATESIRDQVEGFVIPIRSSSAIETCLFQLLTNRDLLHAMKDACLRRAYELSWLRYQSLLMNSLASLL